MTAADTAAIPAVILGVLLGGLLVAMVLMYVQKEREIRQHTAARQRRQDRIEAALRELADALQEGRQ